MAIFLGNVRAGRILHKSILRNIIASPMTFFDLTPVGRILNRFGKDLDVVDTLIAHNFSMWFVCTIRVISVPVVIGYSTPLFLTLVVPLVIIYYVVQVGKISLLFKKYESNYWTNPIFTEGLIKKYSLILRKKFPKYSM